VGTRLRAAKTEERGLGIAQSLRFFCLLQCPEEIWFPPSLNNKTNGV